LTFMVGICSFRESGAILLKGGTVWQLEI